MFNISTQQDFKLRAPKNDALEIAKIFKRFGVFENVKTVPLRNSSDMYVISNYDLRNRKEVITILNELDTRFLIRRYI